MLSEPVRPHTSTVFSVPFSDLMKSTEVDESLSTTTTTILFQRKPAWFKIYSTECESTLTLLLPEISQGQASVRQKRLKCAYVCMYVATGLHKALAKALAEALIKGPLPHTYAHFSVFFNSYRRVLH